VLPTSTAGESARWKNDQKNAPKKHNSLNRNHSMPSCRPSTAKGESSPLVPSRLMSAHQSPPVRAQIASEAKAPATPPNWNHTTKLEAKRPPPIPATAGHGDHRTRCASVCRC